MEINTIFCREELVRHSFDVKSVKRDGLLLRIRHAPSPPKPIPTRFTNSAYNAAGDTLACSNQSGDIIIFNLRLQKFWTLGLVAVGSALIKFNPFRASELLIGGDGFVGVVEVSNGEVVGVMEGHGGVVTDASFSGGGLVVTSCGRDAIIWRAERNYAKVRVLEIGKAAVLKFVVFMPITDDVLACYQTGSMQVWKGGTMEPSKQILPSAINNLSVRTIAFTRDGTKMILGGYSPQLLVFLLGSWSTSARLPLPDQSRGVRSLSFVDCQGNRVLIALTTNGGIVFYDLVKEGVLSVFPPKDVIRVEVSPPVKQMSCVLGNGEVLVFNLEMYLKEGGEAGSKEGGDGGRKEGCCGGRKRGVVLRKPEIKKVQEEMKSELALSKLRGILREFGEYPQLYRTTIWSKILQIPNDHLQYRDLTKSVYDSPFQRLEISHPLHDKRYIRILKRTLNDLVSWCPFFADVEFLPAFVFPFVIFLQTEPIVCFEIIMTIITNYCQYWFEYHPLPPVNVLGMIENVLLEHDPELLLHLQSHEVNSQLYAWPLLQTAYSEVLPANQFLSFWDHVLSNEPAFLLLSAPAYNLMHRNTLLSFADSEQFSQFYQQQNPMDFKRFISKCYQLLSDTSEKNHPRQYLGDFVGRSVYPKFGGFPKASDDFAAEVRGLQEESGRILEDERGFMRERMEEIERVKIKKREAEEILRLSELRILYQDRLNEERKYVIDQRNRLRDFRSKIQAEETQVLSAAHDDLLAKRRGLSGCGSVIRPPSKIICDGIGVGGAVAKAEEELLEHYGKLLRHKMQIGRMLQGEGRREELERDLEEEYNRLANEIIKARATSTSTSFLKQLNVATGLAAMDNLIQKVEQEIVDSSTGSSGCERKTQVRRLEQESKELGDEIANLMKLLNKVK